METVHLIVGVAVLATNLAAGASGGDRLAAPAAQRRLLVRAAGRPGAGRRSRCCSARSCSSPATRRPTSSTTSTGVLPLLVSLLAEAARAGAAERELEGLDFDSLPRDRQRAFALAIVRRETGIMAVSALVVLFLALRAAGTSGALF